MEQVSPHVFIDPSHGPCTVGAIQTPEGVVLIDSPNKPTRAVRWVEEVRALGEVRYLINTEYHVDHTFGNFFLPGTIIAHAETQRNFWKDGLFGPSSLKDPRKYVEKGDPQGIRFLSGYKVREPEITFNGRLTLFLGGVTVELLPMPGHVPADTAVYIPQDRALFAGDNVFNGAMTWYHECLCYEWLETLDHFKQMDVKVVIPGHGNAAGPEVFDKMRRGVEDAIREVEAAVDSGMSREEAMKKITFLGRQPVAEDHRELAPKLQPIFVGRIYDQVLARRA